MVVRVCACVCASGCVHVAFILLAPLCRIPLFVLTTLSFSAPPPAHDWPQIENLEAEKKEAKEEEEKKQKAAEEKEKKQQQKDAKEKEQSADNKGKGSSDNKKSDA